MFKRFDLLGQVTEHFADEDLALRPSGALEFAASGGAGPHRLELPLDLDVVNFGTSR